MPSNIQDFVIPEGREVRTTPAASSDEDDFLPSSAQEQASDVEEERTVGLKPFNSKSRGIRKAKAPSEHDDKIMTAKMIQLTKMKEMNPWRPNLQGRAGN